MRARPIATAAARERHREYLLALAFGKGGKVRAQARASTYRSARTNSRSRRGQIFFHGEFAE